MIDEMAEVRAYLAGKKPTARTEYRCIYLLARYYVYCCGMDEPTATTRILDWGRHEVGYEFSIRVSRVVYYAIHKPRPLREDVTVFINDNDIAEIKARFAKRKIRLLALGMLAYAKCTADENSVFDVSVVGMADWLGLTLSSVRRWLTILEECGFMQKITQRKRKKKFRTPISKFKILIPLVNEGQYAIRDNNIADIAEAVFTD